MCPWSVYVSLPMAFYLCVYGSLTSLGLTSPLQGLAATSLSTITLSRQLDSLCTPSSFAVAVFLCHPCPMHLFSCCAFLM